MPGLLDFMGLGNMPEGGVGGMLSGMLAPPNDPTVPKSAPGAGGGGLPGILAPPFDPMAGPQAPDSPALRPDEYGRAPGAGAPAAAPSPGPMQGGAVPFLANGQTPFDPAAMPSAATPTVGQSSPQPMPLTPPNRTPAAQVAQSAGAGGGGLLDRVQSFLTRNKNTLAGMGAGLAGAPNWGVGISRGMQGNIAGGQLDRERQGENLTERALVGKGFSPTEAAAAARNPQMLRALLPTAFAPPAFHTFTDSSGNQSGSFVNSRDMTLSTPTAVPAGTVRAYSPQQVDALPPGTVFIDPYGQLRKKP